MDSTKDSKKDEIHFLRMITFWAAVFVLKILSDIWITCSTMVLLGILSTLPPFMISIIVGLVGLFSILCILYAMIDQNIGWGN